MQTTQAVCGSVLWLGRRGENEARAITFDLTDWQTEYGDGTVQGLAKRVYDYYAYPVALTVDGATATWTITDADVAQAGQYGSFELRYYIGDVLVKSAIWKTAVDQSIGEITDAPTAPEQAWGETIIQAGADAQAAAEAAAASAAEIVGMTADATTLAAGEAATVTKTVQSGVVNLSFGIPRGADGAQGAQGEKGDTGEAGPAGPAGPNIVSTATTTTLTGVLVGDGANVGAINPSGYGGQALVVDGADNWSIGVPDANLLGLAFSSSSIPADSSAWDDFQIPLGDTKAIVLTIEGLGDERDGDYWVTSYIEGAVLYPYFCKITASADAPNELTIITPMIIDEGTANEAYTIVAKQIPTTAAIPPSAEGVSF